MTFLQYLLTQYLGQPSAERADGVAYWPCPQCGSESFHTLPIRGQFMKERAKCWSAECGFRGDDMDMLREFHPDETWAELFKRRDRLRGSYQQYKRRLLGSRRGDTNNRLRKVK